MIASGGSRALTQRAVDAEAHLPSGSTSTAFRTRRSLAAAFMTVTLREAHLDALVRAALLLDPDGEELRQGRERLLLDAHGDSSSGVDRGVRRLVVVLVDGLLLDTALHGAEHDPDVVARSIDGVIAGAARR